jgi:N-acetylglucosaminyldiphosphoundecaprenol N-acetyl-beta-D-mannosaminyltransferase
MNATVPVAEICGIPISKVRIETVLTAMDEAIKTRQIGGYISITNTESMYHGLRMPEHYNYIRSARFSLCDGVGVVIPGLVWGHRIQRINGPMLQLECCRYGVQHGWRHFFYGGKEGVAELLADNLSKMFPGMITAGTYCPPFRPLTPEEDEEIVEKINDARPDILWVGLGLLKQERWITEHLRRIRVPWMIGVGGAFDYHSGAVKWAPAWIRKTGMEWLFRLILQPRLRAMRYWWSLVFVCEALYQGILHRIVRAKE